MALLRSVGLGLAVAVPLVALDRRRRRRRDAALRGEARAREADRSWLSAQVVTAEQDERRRLSVALHDGPLGSLAGIVLIGDAALSAIRGGEIAEAERLLESALDRARSTVAELRDLSVAMEPVVLRDHSFEAAVAALAEQLERDGRISVAVDVADADLLAEKAKAALYQTVREALAQARRRRPARIEVTVRRAPEGSYEICVTDDGVEERRQAGADAIAERARLLGGRVAIETNGRGTSVVIGVPAYVASPR